MKISKKTELILKNFATISPSLAIRAGNILSTSDGIESGTGVIYARAETEEHFPFDMEIYSLSTLLSMMSSVPDYDFIPEERQVIITNGSIKYSYLYTAPNILPYHPPRDASFTWNTIFKTTLSGKEFQNMMRAADTIKIDEFNLVSDGTGSAYIKIHNRKTSSDSFEALVGKTENQFSAWFKAPNFKIIPDDYQMSLCYRKGKTRDVIFLLLESELIEYMIAADPASTFMEKKNDLE